MSLRLVLKASPEVPLEAEVISPARLAGLTESEVERLPLLHGNEAVPLREFFEVQGRYDGELRLVGDLGRVKLVGAGMSAGRIVIEGRIGMHLGAGMSGGEILVQGAAGDWVGPDMSGGRITIMGDAGHMVGSAYRGAALGIRGGEILIHGTAGNEIGNAMRNGLIAVGGDCGDFAGVNMLAGTIVVFGTPGIRCGAGMKRGTLVAMHPVELLPTFRYACSYEPGFLRLYLSHLRRLGLPVSREQLDGRYQRWSGDAIEMNRGEALLFEG